MTNSNDRLYLVWKEPDTRKQLLVGQLIKDGKYYFEYLTEGVTEAQQHGFKPLIAFEDTGKKYESDILFPVFKSRLPDKKRRDIKTILSKYKLENYDEYLLLKNSGARLPIDDLEFVPLFEDSYHDLSFNLAGVRHYIGCSGTDCEKAIELYKDQQLFLEAEPNNLYDECAVKVLNGTGQLVGYVPRFYSKQLIEHLSRGEKYSLTVQYIVKDKYDCGQCIRVNLKIGD